MFVDRLRVKRRGELSKNKKSETNTLRILEKIFFNYENFGEKILESHRTIFFFYLKLQFCLQNIFLILLIYIIFIYPILSYIFLFFLYFTISRTEVLMKKFKIIIKYFIQKKKKIQNLCLPKISQVFVY